MYDGNKVIPGLIIFIGLMTFPVWYNKGSAGPMPKPEVSKEFKECVRPALEMRTSHMQLLNQWRDEVVRDAAARKGHKTLKYGIEYEKSLQKGCMHCHNDKKKFCDECHTYTAVKPYCWDCHFPPKETL